MKALILYHGSDLDGLCCGAIAKYALDGECELMPMEYGDILSSDTPALRNLYIMDFSFPPALMRRYAEIFPSVTWIDHHKSAIENPEMRNIPGVVEYLSVGIAACELAWKFFFPTESTPMPLAVEYLGKYDSWRHNDDADILGFQYGMRAVDMDPRNPRNIDAWSSLFCDKGVVNEVIRDGLAIHRYVKRQNEEIAKRHTFEVNVPRIVKPNGEVQQLPAIAMNTQMANSQAFEGVYDPAKHKLMVAFRRFPERWSMSFYSTHADIDCGMLAKQFNGGGHKGAAGFACKDLPDWLSVKGR